jgi:hypothetical protein
VTFFVSQQKFFHSNNILTITKGDLMELLHDINVISLSKNFYLLDRVSSRRKDEVNRSDGCRVIINSLQDLGL